MLVEESQKQVQRIQRLLDRVVLNTVSDDSQYSGPQVRDEQPK